MDSLVKKGLEILTFHKEQNKMEKDKLFKSKCKKDYLGHHRWKKEGVILDTSKLTMKVYLIWRCSQCGKCIREELQFLEDE